MQYNSNQDQLVFPEYGRNVQEMIRTIRTEEDPVKRQKYANAIANLMVQLSPSPKNGNDIRPRVWKHFFAIAEYNIDVLSNEGIKYDSESGPVKPSRIEYPEYNEKYRQYGNHVRKLIERAALMEDGPKKNYMISLIGSYMKMAYKTWNKDHYVSDEGIMKDLVALSKGKLKIESETSLDVLSRKGKGVSLQPASSEPRPIKTGRYRSNNNRNNNRRYNDRNSRNQGRRR
ncbi:MAG: DUF4290 domain-containing protein [Saprospiraceae bacterium]